MANNTKKNNRQQPRQILGGGTRNKTDIRGARRDAERVLMMPEGGPQKAKQMLQKQYGYSSQQAQRMINNIRKR